MALFFGEDDLEDAVTKDIGILVKFLVLEEVALVNFHRLEQGVVLRTVHIFPFVEVAVLACKRMLDCDCFAMLAMTYGRTPAAPDGCRSQTS